MQPYPPIYPSDPTRRRSPGSARAFFLWTLVWISFAISAALFLATTLGWSGRISTILAASQALLGAILTIPARRSTDLGLGLKILCLLLTLLSLSVALFATWTFRDTPPELGPLRPPEQRTISDIVSECGTPSVRVLTETPTVDYKARAVFSSSSGGGDLVAVLIDPNVYPDPDANDLRLDVIGCNGDEWERIFSHPIESRGCGYFKLQVVQLRTHSEQEIVASRTCGSGGFLSFKILGFDESSREFEILHEKKDLQSGEVAQRADHIVIVNSTEVRGLKWIGNKFVDIGILPEPPPLEGKQIAYWWKGDKGYADILRVNVEPHERIYLVWDRTRDTSNYTTPRILADSVSYEHGITAGPPPFSFLTDDSGQSYLEISSYNVEVNIRISPDGDHAHAIIITAAS
ncbi:hypothetical protein O7543_00905 [Solwaraspora sp. WMMA2080]|uniref:hypothetical protein n=1 Tax=unclassified Solwaraspora TaxID=2627926 RepID=UPI00248A9E7C|nr:MULTISPECIES: hypothetical protein [unclassified Solwaraspora]WBB95016.1 hypothetical protein O7553_16470 [Solwaraspora sp. WMMA2059]WBC21101.1 hypothetical protein O7543_00905 [Solwaraspora sp. WMMA2080]